MPRIALRDVTVRYPGTARPALEGLTLELGPGVTGLVGRNGAGKSSLLRLLLGAVRCTAGEVVIDGRTPDDYRCAEGIGFLPERPAFPPHLTAGEFLEGVRAACGEPAEEDAPALGVDALVGMRLDALSLGQKRRVELAAALAGAPRVLLLDEPTNGLDPLAVAALRRAVDALRRPDRVILVSSHHLDELQRMVDRVVVLEEGRVAAAWEAADLRETGATCHDRFLDLVGAADA